MDYFKKLTKKAFTLAEILIALVLIGVLTAILLPVAFHASPDENVMKFKKGNNTLVTVIRELVTSDDYYKDGDLGIKKNGDLIDGSHDGDITYFCNSFADMINAKGVSCSENGICRHLYCWNHLGKVKGKQYCTLEQLKQYADEGCADSAEAVGAEITTADKIIYYQVSPAFMFGATQYTMHQFYNSSNETEDSEESADWHETYTQYRKSNQQNDEGFDATYKFICMDIDGINEGEAPFGYALRYDGKIIAGARADEWMEKSIQKGNE